MFWAFCLRSPNSSYKTGFRLFSCPFPLAGVDGYCIPQAGERFLATEGCYWPFVKFPWPVVSCPGPIPKKVQIHNTRIQCMSEGRAFSWQDSAAEEVAKSLAQQRVRKSCWQQAEGHWQGLGVPWAAATSPPFSTLGGKSEKPGIQKADGLTVEWPVPRRPLGSLTRQHIQAIAIH